ncbi:MAG: 2-dehydropantoate 2-reductase [Ketobacter sp.]|nr:MAG: 2-dehydropantoate 2-reductase [Ketobacter sp.]
MTTTWHILGPGAIGSLFGCYLQQAGFGVHLIGRNGGGPQTIELVESDIITRHQFEEAPPDQPISHLLVTVKAQQTLEAIEAVRSRLAPTPCILLLQNGMGAWEAVAERLRNAILLLGTTTEGANRPAPNRVIHAGSGETYIGALETRHQTEAEALCRQWANLPLTLAADPNIHGRLWRKLAINCAINPLTAIYDCPNGDLLQNPHALAQMEAVCTEVEAVMTQVLGEETRGLFTLAKSVAAQTGNNISSMLQDVRKQRTTEIDFITGYLLEQAHRLGLACPSNQALLNQVKQM